jgi:putative ABC transport system permease protein
MLVKLAMRNVRRAGRDYAIYFITVTLGVALFYAFNAVRSQAVLFDALSADSVRMLGLLTMLIGLFSVVVACVLGFLVVYANRFLIRRRRREFGTYLLLGMGAGRVSCMLLCETFLVGAVSLVAGLALGVAVSQGLSFLTAALMGTTMTKYRFIVSTDALVLTAVSFAAIFAV